MVIQTTEKQLKVLIKQSVQELLKREIMKIRAGLIAVISDAEQHDIEQKYGAPSRRATSSHLLKV